MTTFSVIGGASAYAPGLLSALLSSSSQLHLSEVRLFDIDQRRLDLIHRLTSKMAIAAGSPFKVVSCTGLSEAVRGANVILNSARPGGFECRRIDESLPLEFGIPGQETVGPGGFFFALRSVPEALEIHRHMVETAPNAQLLNYTNPTNIVTQALNNAGPSPVEVLGLCDQSDEDIHALAEANDAAGQDIRFACNGLNHGTWYTDLMLGEERFSPRVRQTEFSESFDAEHRLRYRLSAAMAAEHPGFWPNSYLAYYEDPEAFVALARRSGLRTDAILAGLDRYYDHFREEAEREVPTLRMHRGSSGFGDLAVRTLRGLLEPEGQYLVLNTRNEGCTSLFDDGTVIETRVRVGRTGIERQPAPRVPESAMALLKRLEAYQLATAEVASARPSNSLLAEALALNPLVPNRSVAEAMIERAKVLYRDEIRAFA